MTGSPSDKPAGSARTTAGYDEQLAAFVALDAQQRALAEHSRPVDALDAQTGLVKALADPTGVAFAGRAFGGVGEGESWERMRHLTPDQVAGFRRELITAATYWVAPDLVDVIEIASRSMPSQPLLATDLPVENGFVWFPFSVWPRGVEATGGVGLRAVSWHRPESLGGAGQLRLVLYFDRDNWRIEAGGDDPPWPLFPGRWHLWTLGAGFESELKGGDIDGDTVIVPHALQQVRRLCQAFWSILAEPYTTEARERPPRPARRRAEAAGMTTTEAVRVLDLRRPRSAHGGHSRSVAWSNRWMVSGHWRNQWYPSAGTHRQRYILPYIKGPADKPLDVRSTVRALRR